ncbi:hypothetical protein [Streptomyces clavifer]|uniref:hypothetical protein n=1 Tax=Streptomyces clavifer TaxID=68188 RepID=UPI003826D157
MTTASTPAQPTVPAAAAMTSAILTAAPVTAPWVVVTLSVLSGVVGMALCVGAGVLVWVRPGAMNPLSASLAMGGFLVGVAALVVAVVVTVRRR